MALYRADLQALLAPTVEGMGFELVGVEHAPAGRGSLLRIYIDSEAGIDVDDCAEVSHQVSGLLDVEDPIGHEYRLEVSSPGIDRPLFVREHFERFAGHRARIKLRFPIEKMPGRKLTVELGGVEGDSVRVTSGDEEFMVPLQQIDSARLIPEL
jgi:ribosome maturation factor RimP